MSGKYKSEAVQLPVVVSQFTPAAGAGLNERKLTTYLEMQNEEWKVDYQKTLEAMKTNKTGGFEVREVNLKISLQQYIGSFRRRNSR